MKTNSHLYKIFFLQNSIFRANCILEEVFIDLKNIKCFEELMTKQWYEVHVPFKIIMLKVYVACTWVFPQQVRQKIESIFYL